MFDKMPCPYCDGRGATCPHQANGQPGNRMERCGACLGRGWLRNGTLPGVDITPPPPPKQQKEIARGQLDMFTQEDN